MSERVDAVVQYLIARAKEASTYRGIILVGTAFFGWTVDETKAQAIMLAGLTAAGLVGVIFPDKTKPPQP